MTTMNQRIPVKDFFDYQDGRLFWRFSKGSRIKAGEEAGSVYRSGRRYVQIENKKYLTHRLIYLWHYGECPEFLDHIDRDPSNNRIENLRPASKRANAQNRSIRSDNKTGFKGIYKQKNRYRATICVNGKNIYLGSYGHPLEAQAAYAKAAAHHFGEFAHV
jgi:hypothetical protein